MATSHDNQSLQDLEPTRYLRQTSLDVPGAVALGIALVSAADKRLPTAPKRALKQLRQSVIALQEDWAAQRRSGLLTEAEEDRRPADQRLDRVWAAVAMRLESVAALTEVVTESKQAGELYAQLFPTGLDFLKLPFEREWAQSEQRMEQLADGDVRGPLEALVGAFVLNELRDAHANYGRVLGITTARGKSTVAPNLLDPLRTVQQGISAYALQVIAAAHADPEMVGIARAALRPIDAVREAQARRASAREGAAAGATPEVVDDAGLGGVGGEVTPTTPVPEADEV